MLELTDEHYEPKKMVVARITYLIDVNKDNIFISEVEDFDTEDGTEEDYEDLKRTDEELERSAINELAEIIYNSVKYNDLAEMISVEFHNV
jgi:Ran GTPase-activating protein (RanGAP) involved in mRNA processing and transport